MTETTTLASEKAKPRLCQAGNKSERPCWRPATEADLFETEPKYCPEHMMVRRCGENLDARLHALEATRAFLKSEAVEHDPHSYLRELAIGWYDSVTEDAATAAHKRRLAEFLAERGPEDAGPERAIMREYGAHLFVRSDAMNDAFATLIDEREPSETDRLAIIAALKEASRRVSEEYDKFREEQGIGS
jgi:hypothetical protein